LVFVSPAIRPLEWIRPPQQERSHKTLERLLEAGEVLISQKGYDRTSVAEICQLAGSSVGAFYARFPDKQALLHQLHDRFAEQAGATIDAALDPSRWDGASVEDFIRTGMRFLLGVFRERRELIAALSRCETRDAAMRPFGHQLGEQLSARCVEFLHARGETVHHDDPAEAVRFLCWLILSAVEAHTAHLSDVDPMPAERIADHMARMCTAYLGIQPS
jgi:AcrR family transcriptional regulator